MRSWGALLIAIMLALPGVESWVLPRIRPLYRPVDEVRSLYATYQWCRLKESQPTPIPHEPSVPPGMLRLRETWPRSYPQRLLLEGEALGSVLVKDSFFAGRIVQSSGKWHEAYTLYTPQLCVSVQFKGREVWGVLCGGKTIVLHWIPLYEAVQTGETLITAGIGEIPEGLYVGSVARVETSLVEPGFYLIQVQPFVDYHRTLFFRSMPNALPMDRSVPRDFLP